MKFIAVILSFYLLLLTAIPCIDGLYEDNSAHQTELAQERQDSHHHSDSDNCSPFCTCNCCATAVVLQVQLVQLNCFPFSEKQYFPNTSVFISDPSATIWQPPKIV